MQNIFCGMLLSLLNFSFIIGDSKIGLIPSFLGYIFMLRGIRELAIESDNFTKIKTHTKLMIVYTLFEYIADLLGIRGEINDVFNIALGIIFAIVALYISYNIIMGIADIEKANNHYLKSDELYSKWRVLAIFTMLVYPAVFIPAVALIIIIIGFVVNVCFLIEFNNSKNLYYESKQSN